MFSNTCGPHIPLVLEIVTWKILYWWSLCSDSFMLCKSYSRDPVELRALLSLKNSFYSFSSMEMSLKLSTHFSAFMLFQPSFFLFLLLLLEAFTNRQVQGLRNFHRACVQNRSKENWYFSGSRKSRGTVDLWFVGLKQDDIVETHRPCP